MIARGVTSIESGQLVRYLYLSGRVEGGSIHTAFFRFVYAPAQPMPCSTLYFVLHPSLSAWSVSSRRHLFSSPFFFAAQ